MTIINCFNNFIKHVSNFCLKKPGFLKYTQVFFLKKELDFFLKTCKFILFKKIANLDLNNQVFLTEKIIW